MHQRPRAQQCPAAHVRHGCALPCRRQGRPTQASVLCGGGQVLQQRERRVGILGRQAQHGPFALAHLQPQRARRACIHF